MNSKKNKKRSNKNTLYDGSKEIRIKTEAIDIADSEAKAINEEPLIT